MYSIETKDLTRKFGDFMAVDGLNLTVKQGTMFGFLGPNGAGKSTTIKMLTGLIKITQGTANVLGYDVDRSPVEIKKRIGVVPEEMILFDRLTGREYLTFIGRMHRLDKKTIKDRIDELLELMNLQNDRKKLIVDYSHGMQKKIAFSAALIHNPDLLFLDEPFEGIDAVSSRLIKNLMDSMINRGVTIFLTSHILEIVEKLCSDVAIINQGKLVAQETLSELQQGTQLDSQNLNSVSVTLEEIFLRLVRSDEPVRTNLSWLS